MDHEAHIGLIDTHTKGDGSHNHIDVLHQEIILRLGSGTRVKSCMIGCCLDIIGLKHGSQFLNLLSRQTVDDTALAWVLFDELDDILVDILRFRTHLVVKVRTIEGTLELLGIDHTEVLLDIRSYLIRGRSRQCDDRRLAYLVDDRTDTTVLRTEVMSPFRDTVGLVDSIEGNLHRLQELHVLFLRQRLRSHIEQFGDTRLDISLHLVYGRLVQRRVQIVGRPFVLTQISNNIYLVLHQGNQGRYDNSRTFHQQRGQLIAQRLTATCRHQHERVVTIQQVTDNLLLVALELVETKVFLQGFSQIGLFAHIT